jgi:ABC-type antimicrobial peptide transport system permease subunit
VHVELPAGRFGRPVLDVTEAWWAKGVAIRFVDAVRTQDVVLFSMVLVGAAVLVAESAFVSVRRRRSEFGVLRALGWPLWRIAGLVETEMILLGLGAGVIGAVSALLLRMTVLAALPVGLVLLSVVLATVIGGVAGLVPAVSAARGSAISVISGSGPIRRSRAPFSAATLGLRQMRRERRLEALLGIGAVALGAALLGGVVLAAGAFRNRLDVTTLGSFLGSEVHPFHVAIAAMALAFGAIAAGEIVVLGYIEREREFGVMRAVGWPRSRVLAILGAQGVAMGLLGGLLGGLLVLVGGSVAGEPSSAVLRGAISGALVASVATAVAVAGAMILVYRVSPARALRGE